MTTETQELTERERKALDVAVALTTASCAGVVPEQLPAHFERILAGVKTAMAGVVAEPAPTPAVPIKKSHTDDEMTCLCCGAKFKSLKRHIRVYHAMTPEEYRKRWGLPVDYPMVAANYSAIRSQLAKANGLGQRT